jgi:hypothetical protein
MVTIIKKGSDIKAIRKALSKHKPRKGVDASKYCGVIKLKEDPLAIQKKMRDEWE